HIVDQTAASFSSPNFIAASATTAIHPPENHAILRRQPTGLFVNEPHQSADILSQEVLQRDVDKPIATTVYGDSAEWSPKRQQRCGTGGLQSHVRNGPKIVPRSIVTSDPP